jgi:hypothetical protein
MGAPKSENEIPLLLTLLYLFHEVDGALPLLLVLRRASRGAPIQVEDIVRWGVWLGRHIC